MVKINKRQEIIEVNEKNYGQRKYKQSWIKGKESEKGGKR
jgi:hypothetical protein